MIQRRARVVTARQEIQRQRQMRSARAQKAEAIWGDASARCVVHMRALLTKRLELREVLWRHYTDVRDAHGGGLEMELAAGAPPVSAGLPRANEALMSRLMACVEAAVGTQHTLGQRIVQRAVKRFSKDLSHGAHSDAWATVVELATQQMGSGAEGGRWASAEDPASFVSGGPLRALDLLAMVAGARAAMEAASCAATQCRAEADEWTALSTRAETMAAEAAAATAAEATAEAMAEEAAEEAAEGGWSVQSAQSAVEAAKAEVKLKVC